MQAEAAVSIKDVAELLFAARERIDFYWNFYVIVIVAVVGWLVTLKKPLTVPMKVVVTVAYLIAATMNFLGLYSAYTFAEALRTDLLRIASDPAIANTRLILEQHSYIAHRWGALFAHIGLGLPILLAVWFARFSERDNRAGDGEDPNQKQWRRHVALKAMSRAFRKK